MRCQTGDIALIGMHHPNARRHGTLVQCIKQLGRSRCRALDAWHENVWHVRYLVDGLEAKNGLPVGIPDAWLTPIRGGLAPETTSAKKEA